MPQRLRKAADGELARRIGGLPRRRDQTEQARNVDQPRFLALVQERQERARHPHHAPEIDPEQPVEIAFRDLDESSVKRHASIVDQNIDAAVFGGHLRGKRRDRSTVCDVEVMPADADGLFNFVAGDVGGGARERRIVDVGKREMAAAACQ
jgi:hypothetical protein